MLFLSAGKTCVLGLLSSRRTCGFMPTSSFTVHFGESDSNIAWQLYLHTKYSGTSALYGAVLVLLSITLFLLASTENSCLKDSPFDCEFKIEARAIINRLLTVSDTKTDLFFPCEYSFYQTTGTSLGPMQSENFQPTKSLPGLVPDSFMLFKYVGLKIILL
jgi:hypothetical protein